MKKHLLLLIALVSISLCSIAQSNPSCCSMPATQQFAMLGKDKEFSSSHLAPIPFEYDSPNGKMITLKSSDNKSANAFEIRSSTATQNYLIVIHEWWGLNDYIKQEAEKLQTQLGNVNVIALDLYDGKIASNPEDAGKYMGEAKEDRIKTIIQAAISYAGKDAKIQTLGWCFGGGWSLQATILAAKQSRGCVMYYGMPEKDLQKIKSISAPVLGLFASQDGWITKDIVGAFENTMKENKKEIRVEFFDAQHAFANPSNPKYDEVAASKANQLAIEFLKKNLSR